MRLIITLLGIVFIGLGSMAMANDSNATNSAAYLQKIYDTTQIYHLAALPQCVDPGQTCVIGGTPCCGSNTCKGEFPNTTCQ